MQRYEFKVVPAPRRGEKARGVKTTEDRFALALTLLMNDFGAEGWDYVRADALPCEERVGLTGTKTTFQNMLVFRRPLAEEAATAEPAVAPPRLMLEREVAPASVVRPLGPAEAPMRAAAPTIHPVGPAKTDLAAE
ncbi:MAG: hypothetical protein B7Z31_06465 [Rhodobacterales bacterium 12-65-15]|nr:MAG: hypothetical protein B7Z31_06465 [Rhodobacterales bacterium 12-65-15]